MADIFLSYAREDQEIARAFADAFMSEGWGVWWDTLIGPGTMFQRRVAEQLNAASCVVVLWSQYSVSSSWVLEEADVARVREVLVPVQIDSAPLPVGFRLIQTASLVNWDRRPTAAAFAAVCERIKAIIASKASNPASRLELTVVDFPNVNTTDAPGHKVAAAPYLHDFGLDVVQSEPDSSEVVLLNNRGAYGGRAVHPSTTENFITQSGTNNQPAWFLLVLQKECDIVRFTRPTLYPATESGVTHPAWAVHAFDRSGDVLASHSQGLIRSFSDVPARTYELEAPAFEKIAGIRFSSDPNLDGKPFAGFSALLIERLTLIRKPQE